MRRFLVRFLALSAVVAVAVVIYAFTPKANSSDPALEPTTSWVLNSKSGLYGRVNLKDLEITAKQSIADTTPFRNATVVEWNERGSLASAGKAFKIDPSVPMDVTGLPADQTVALPENANVMNQANSSVLLLSPSGNLFVGTAPYISTGANVKKVNEDGEKYLTGNIAPSGDIIAYNESKQIVKFSAHDFKREVLREGIPEQTPDFALDTFEVALAGKDFAFRYEQTNGNDAELWGNNSDPITISQKSHLSHSSDDAQIVVTTQDNILRWNGTQFEDIYSLEITPLTLARTKFVRWHCEDGSRKFYSVYQTASGVYVYSCKSLSLLENSDSVGDDSTIFSVREIPGGALVNATDSGVVWVERDGVWQVVPSTLNAWSTKTISDRDESSTLEDALTNYCPLPPAPEDAQFGARPGRDNFLPVLRGVLDPNKNDVLTIVGDVVSDNPALGDFRIIENGKAVALRLIGSAVTSGSANFTVNVTDGGSGTAGPCIIPMSFSVQIHPYSEPNHPPRRIGNTVPDEHLKVGKYPATATVDALNGWVDPDGDDLVLTSESQTGGQVVASPEGRMSFQALNVEPGDRVGVGIKVSDTFGLSTRSTLSFEVFDTAPIYFDQIALTVSPNETTVVDLDESIHGAAGYYDISLVDVPENIAATIDTSGTQMSITANSAGTYEIKFSVLGSTNQGTIKLLVTNDQVRNAGFSPRVVFVGDHNDIVQNLDTMASASLRDNYILTQAEVESYEVSGANIASLEANIVDYRSIRISGSVTNYDASTVGVYDAGTVILTLLVRDPYTSTEHEVRVGIHVMITTNVSSVAPIASPDQVAVHLGSSIDVDVLANDIAALGDVLLVDPRYSTPEEDVATKGLAYASGNKIKYVAPLHSDESYVQLDYYVFVRGHGDTRRAAGRLNVHLLDTQSYAPESVNLRSVANVGGTAQLALPSEQILDRDGDNVFITDATVTSGNASVQISSGLDALVVTSSVDTPTQIQGTYTLSDGVHTTGAPFTVQTIVSNQQAVPFNDYVFGAANSDKKIRVNPLDNDLLPAGTQAQLISAKLLPPNAARDQTPLQEITDEEQLKNFSIVIGEIGARSVWEVTAQVTSTGASPEFQAGEVIGEYTQNVIAISTDEPTVPAYPSFEDYFVKNSDIKQRKFFESDITDSISSTQNIDELDISGFDKLNSDNHLEYDAGVIKGQMRNSSQTLVVRIRAPFESGPLESFGVVRVPSLSTVVPSRRDHSVKQVNVGDTLNINVFDEVDVIEDMSLLVSDDLVHSRLRPQSTCSISDGVISYTPGVMAAGVDVDTLTKDICAVYVRFDDSNSKDVLISFQINIIPENSPPTLARNPQLIGAEPKQSVEIDARKYLKWYGHPASEIDTLQLICSAQIIEVSCGGTRMSVSVPQTAKELSNHEIRVTVVGYDTSAVVWTFPILATVKVANIEVPLHPEKIVIREGQEAPTVNVTPTVQRHLEQFYYGMQEGASIQCAPAQDPKVTCTSTASGVLRYGIAAGSEDTGFMTTGRYAFTDRAASESGQNKGTGEVTIEYQALPKRPAQPALNYEDARVGVVNLTIYQSAFSLPQTTELCLHIEETGSNLCKNTNGNMSVSFSTNSDLENLDKWHTYHFYSYAVNSVGKSPDSISITATPFVPLRSPTVSWYVTGDKKLHLKIIGRDSNTSHYEIYMAGRNIPSVPYGENPAEITMSNGATSDVIILAKSIAVISGSEQIVANANPVSLQVVMPAIPRISHFNVVPNDETMKFTASATFSHPNAAGTTYQYQWTTHDTCDGDWIDTRAEIEDAIVDAIPGQNTQVRLCARSLLDPSVSQTASYYQDAPPGQIFGEDTKVSENLVLIPPSSVVGNLAYKTVYDAAGQSASFQIVCANSGDPCNSVSHAGKTYTVEAISQPSITQHSMNVRLKVGADEYIDHTYDIPAYALSAKYAPSFVRHYLSISGHEVYLGYGEVYQIPTIAQVFASAGQSTIAPSDARLEISLTNDNFALSPQNEIYLAHGIFGRHEDGVRICVIFQNDLQYLVSQNLPDDKLCWDYVFSADGLATPPTPEPPEQPPPGGGEEGVQSTPTPSSAVLVPDFTPTQSAPQEFAQAPISVVPASMPAEEFTPLNERNIYGTSE